MQYTHYPQVTLTESDEAIPFVEIDDSQSLLLSEEGAWSGGIDASAGVSSSK